MNKTQNYQLSLWDKTDRLLMADFNEDNGKIDAALANLRDGKAATADLTSAAAALRGELAAAVVAGAYTGDGERNRVISLGFQPKAVIVFDDGGRTYYSISYGGLAVPGHPVTYSGYTTLEIVSTGFFVSYYKISNSNAVCSNASGINYRYIAFR